MRTLEISEVDEVSGGFRPVRALVTLTAVGVAAPVAGVAIGATALVGAAGLVAGSCVVTASAVAGGALLGAGLVVASPAIAAIAIGSAIHKAC